MFERLKTAFSSEGLEDIEDAKDIEARETEKEKELKKLESQVKDYEKIKAEYPDVCFEKYQKLEKEIKDLKQKREDIRPKLKKEHEERGDLKGKYAKTRRKINSRIKELKKKRNKVGDEIVEDPNKTSFDPVARVKQKKENNKNALEAEKAIGIMLQSINKSILWGAELNKIRRRWGDIHVSFGGLISTKKALLRMLQQTLPLIDENEYRRELAEAKLKVIEWKKEAKENEKLNKMFDEEKFDLNNLD